jgi:hypothetical protein
MGTPPTPHQGLRSNLVPFILAPQFTSADVSISFVAGSPTDPNTDPPPVVVGADTLVSGHLTIANINPRVGQRQNVVVYLNELQAPGATVTGHAYTLPVGGRPTTAPPDSDTVVVQFRSVVAATYLVRLQVDGATSALVPATAGGQFSAPTVVVAP